jgi:hypothetical protein
MTLDNTEAASEKPARARYASVNAQWPETLPMLTPNEAIAAAKRLYRFGMKRPWRGKWRATSGRRYTYPWSIEP